MPLPVRILVAGIVGGILVFFVGFFEHQVLNWGGREVYPLPANGYFRELFKEEKLEHKVYAFPAMPSQDLLDHSEAPETPKPSVDMSKPKQRYEDAQKQFVEDYKTGPSGLLFIAPPGEEPVNGKTLGMELASNIIAALIAAWIVSLIAADKTFLWRWKVVVLMGIFGWVSLSASLGIWYRFPWPFIRDDLLCTILEWCVGGAAIAAIIPSTAKEKK